MPAFSGLWDGVHGDAHALSAKVPALSQGAVRVMLTKRGLWGFVRAAGEIAPTTVKQVQTVRSTVTMRGGFDYATRTNDATNEVDVTNLGGGVNVLEDSTEVGNMSAGDLTDIANTVLNNAYPGDDAANGQTGGALSETRAV